MKKFIILSIIILVCGHAQAQETIARFKYEDAEKAFVSENYQECIDNLNEAEKLLGKTAPNILHLKILAQHKLFEKNPFENYEALETLRSNCDTYLANYDIAGLEEKYRDVYDVSGLLPSVSSPKELAQLKTQHDKNQKEASLQQAIEQNNLVFVEGGTYSMGKGKEARQVSLSSFYIGKFEVTREQYGRYTNTANQTRKPQGYMTTWEESMAYCKWMEQQYGGTWRLPTEAEWEYAARGGEKSQNYDFSGSDDYTEVAADEESIVGSKKANELGIYDMSGSLLEWCYDFYDDKYYEYSPKENPMGPSSGLEHVLKGGYGKFCTELKFGNPIMTVYDRQGTPTKWLKSPKLQALVGFRVVYIPE